MDMKKKAESIYLMRISRVQKIKRLEELMLDCYNEMEAQDQNMHPEVKHNSAEGFRVAKNCLRALSDEISKSNLKSKHNEAFSWKKQE